MSEERPVRPARTVRLPLPAAPGAEAERRRIEEVRRRLLAGELDSDLALVETALALLDGDVPLL